MSAVDLIVEELGGPTQASWKLSQMYNRPISYAVVQTWRRRRTGIPVNMRQLIFRDADQLGITNRCALAYLQLRDVT